VSGLKPHSTTSLRAEALQLSLGGRVVLDGVSLALQPGWTAIVGPNGAGKSTLLRALAGLREPDAGRVWLDERPIADWPASQRGRRVAWLAQQGESDGDLTAFDVVMLGRLPHLGLTGAPGPADQAAVEAAMLAAGCAAQRHRRLSQLSGGERQRVLLARALAVGASVLLLDEPTTHLDPPHQIGVVRLLRQMSSAGTRVVSVLHDISLALQADQLMVMKDGRLIAQGAAADVALHAALIDAFDGALAVARVGGRLVAVPMI
jgi:iron complex transport system ATP-binding protein